jgi:hypothetical protein
VETRKKKDKKIDAEKREQCSLASYLTCRLKMFQFEAGFKESKWFIGPQIITSE